MEKIQINNFKEYLYCEELPNGLKVYIVPIKNKKNFSGMIVTKYGGRDIDFSVENQEYKTPTGIAHFLEHKMFEREEDPFKFYGKYGSDVNAATSDDYTCYYFIGSKCFNKSLKYLLTWIQKLDINEQQVEKEKGIILEEANMYKDNPSRVMYNKIKENVFVNDPKKNKVIGSDEDIASITKNNLELCYNNFYVPNNMYLLVSGAINPNKVIEIAKESTKDFLKKENKAVSIYKREPDHVAKEYEEIYMNIGIPKVNVSYKMNKDIFKNLGISPFELDLYLHFIMEISLGSTSNTWQKWIQEDLFTDSFYRITEIESHYVIELHANSNNPDELIKRLEEYVTVLETDENSFEREKKVWISNEVGVTEHPVTTIYNILDDILDYNTFISNKIECIKNLKYDKLLQIKNMLNYKNKIIIKILPLQTNNKKS